MAPVRTAKSVFGRLLLAATSCFLWVERNNRLFRQVKRSPEDIRDCIMVTVRLKLLSFRFKNKQMALVHLWHVTNVDRLVVQASLEVNVVP
ncbi:hypothetical protein Tco_0210208 [Tanacetum coccineum]